VSFKEDIDHLEKYALDNFKDDDFENVNAVVWNLRKNGLDKQKVKETFDSWINHLEKHIGTGEIEGCEGNLCYLNLIKKELGFED